MKSESDSVMISAILAGHQNEYAHLIGRYQVMVYSIVAQKVPPIEVEELVQQIFIKAYMTLATVREKKAFKGVLRQIALRACCDFWRKKKLEREYLENIEQRETSLGVSHELYSADSAKTNQESYEDKAFLDLVLSKLEMEDRHVVVMLFLEEFSLKEVAYALNWSVAKTKVRAFRAKRKLHKIVKEIDGEAI